MLSVEDLAEFLAETHMQKRADLSSIINPASIGGLAGAGLGALGAGGTDLMSDDPDTKRRARIRALTGAAAGGLGGAAIGQAYNLGNKAINGKLIPKPADAVARAIKHDSGNRTTPGIAAMGIGGVTAGAGAYGYSHSRTDGNVKDFRSLLSASLAGDNGKPQAAAAADKPITPIDEVLGYKSAPKVKADDYLQRLNVGDDKQLREAMDKLRLQGGEMVAPEGGGKGVWTPHMGGENFKHSSRLLDLLNKADAAPTADRIVDLSHIHPRLKRISMRNLAGALGVAGAGGAAAYGAQAMGHQTLGSK